MEGLFSMRETWIPLFQDIRNSSLWAHDSDIRIVWFTLLTLADPEGYVPAAIPGIAIAANVHIDKAREAIALFEAPDPDSRTEDNEGRRIQKVPRGWRILNFAAMAERAKHEAEKARKRRWARTNRAAANDTGEDLTEPAYYQGFADGVDLVSTASSGNVDASKSKSKSSPPQKGEDPPTPIALAGDGLRSEEQPRGVVWRTLEGWVEPVELEAEAMIAGVPAEVYRSRLAELRNGPIGGSRGVLDRTAYVRHQFGKWRTWAEQDRARALAPPGAPRGAGGRLPVLLEPSAKHAAFAARHGLDLAAVVRAIVEEDLPDKLGMGRAREVIGERLTKLARGKAQRSASAR
jgi:hypothetical protein